MSKQEPKTAHPSLKSNDATVFSRASSAASSVASELLESDAASQFKDLTKDWSAEATKFIKKNPWAAVLGAAAIGYYLGATRHRGGGR